MTYTLKGGEEIINGVLWGWTGKKCVACKGHGERYSELCDCDAACRTCGGTGEEWGVMPEQPKDLPEEPSC